MLLAEALGGVRERLNARGRQPNGSEPMSAVLNVRAMPSQAARWKRAVDVVGYRSANAFACDAADLYADLIEALAPAALAARIPLRDYAREVLVQTGVLTGGGEDGKK
ncbi:MAG: hypothetical protein KGK07_15245 [Chloroflexota bacterium]|nr:hypothetical protein [Chloroflexota bacterium]